MCGAIPCQADGHDGASERRAERAGMVAEQLVARDIEAPRVLAAMAAVPRHRFVAAGLRDVAYADEPLPIGHGQTISQPYIVALMTQLLAPEAEDRVLEIGTGCGYQTAVLARLVAAVCTIEIVPVLAQQQLRVQGRVLATQLPLHAFKSYVADAVNVDLRRIDGSFKGQVRYAESPKGTALGVQGDAALDDVRVRMAVQAPVDGAEEELRGLRSGEDLLNWKSLGLRGLAVDLAPGKPLSVDVRETALSDFFARVIVQANGRLNLQELVKAKSPATTTVVEPAATPASVVSVNTGGLETRHPRQG